MVEVVSDGLIGADDLLVDALEEEGALLGVGDRSDRDEAGGDEGDQPDEEPGPEGHGQARGERRA